MSSTGERSLASNGLEAEVDKHMEDIRIEDQQKWLEKKMNELSIGGEGWNQMKRVTTTKVRKRGKRKRLEQMDEERARQWSKNAKSWEQLMNSKQSIKTIKEKQHKAKMKKMDEDKLKWYGDKLSLSKEWPNKTNESIIKIYGQNINGVSR